MMLRKKNRLTREQLMAITWHFMRAAYINRWALASERELAQVEAALESMLNALGYEVEPAKGGQQ